MQFRRHPYQNPARVVTFGQRDGHCFALQLPSFHFLCYCGSDTYERLQLGVRGEDYAGQFCARSNVVTVVFIPSHSVGVMIDVDSRLFE